MLLAVDINALPVQLLDRDERLVNVGVFRDEVGAEMKSETFGMEDVRGRLGEIWKRDGIRQAYDERCTGPHDK